MSTMVNLASAIGVSILIESVITPIATDEQKDEISAGLRPRIDIGVSTTTATNLGHIFGNVLVVLVIVTTSIDVDEDIISAVSKVVLVCLSTLVSTVLVDVGV